MAPLFAAILLLGPGCEGMPTTLPSTVDTPPTMLTSPASIRLYFDTSRNMRGFVSGGMESERAYQGLIEKCLGNDYPNAWHNTKTTVYLFNESTMPAQPGDILQRLTNADTYGAERSALGPVFRQIEGTEDDGLSVVLTDLSLDALSVQHADTEVISPLVRMLGRRTIAVLGIRLPFHGRVGESAVHIQVEGARPLFVIIVGMDADVEELLGHLERELPSDLIRHVAVWTASPVKRPLGVEDVIKNLHPGDSRIREVRGAESIVAVDTPQFGIFPPTRGLILSADLSPVLRRGVSCVDVDKRLERLWEWQSTQGWREVQNPGLAEVRSVGSRVDGALFASSERLDVLSRRPTYYYELIVTGKCCAANSESNNWIHEWSAADLPNERTVDFLKVPHLTRFCELLSDAAALQGVSPYVLELRLAFKIRD